MNESIQPSITLKDILAAFQKNKAQPLCFDFDRDPYSLPLHLPLKNKPYGSPFANFNKTISFGDYTFNEQGLPSPRFDAKAGYLYHGTSAAALHSILQDGIIYPALDLVRQKKLVSGEMHKDMQEFPDGKPCGPKWMSRAKMIEMGIIASDDSHLYEFGHAYDVCFGAHPLSAASYDAEDPHERVIIGLDSKICEIHGHSFINGKSEGILHEGPLEIWLSLKQLLVPDERVEEFQEKIQESYLAHVFPYSQFSTS
ncbi:MAG: hypothetical protein AABY00_00455 [Nanoarchaeota archaeon]